MLASDGIQQTLFRVNYFCRSFSAPYDLVMAIGGARLHSQRLRSLVFPPRDAYLAM